MRKSFIYLLLILVLFIVHAGCATNGNEKTQALEESTQPERIISMSPNLTQIIYALGAEDRLVGVDEYSVYPAPAGELPRVGNYLDPDLEALVALRPDVVLVVDTDERMAQMLTGLGLQYENFGNDRISDILASIERLGELTGKEERSTELVDNFNRARNEVEAALEGVGDVRVALVVGRNIGRLQDIYVAGAGNFLGELLEIAGGENVFASETMAWPQVGVEAIVGADPDVIIDSTLSKGASDEEFDALRRDWNELPSLRAVQNDRVIVPREGWFQIPGAYLDSTLMLFAHWLHPEIFPEEVVDPNSAWSSPAE
jgi:iron complex transport system substrate-binding protein